jgi:hypothetical protein
MTIHTRLMMVNLGLGSVLLLGTLLSVVSAAQADLVLAQCFDTNGGLLADPPPELLDRNDALFPQEAQTFVDECSRAGGSARFLP